MQQAVTVDAAATRPRAASYGVLLLCAGFRCTRFPLAAVWSALCYTPAYWLYSEWVHCVPAALPRYETREHSSMLHTPALRADRSVTGPSPTLQHARSRQEWAALQRGMRVCHAITSARQQCRAAHDLMEASNERIMRSRHFLAASRMTLGNDPEAHQPLPQD